MGKLIPVLLAVISFILSANAQFQLIPTIASIFGGLPPIGDIIQHFDFGKVNIVDSNVQDYLNIGLAPAYGTLSTEEVKFMDDHLKVMIAGVHVQLGKLSHDERTWDKVQSLFLQNPVLEPFDDPTTRATKYTKDDTYWLNTDGSPRQTVMNEVKSWFTGLIADADILNSTRIDINIMGRIVAHTGTNIENIINLFYQHEYHEKTMLEIGVLRYPDIEHPYFKVYRIKLFAWSDCRRYAIHESNTNGISGEFNMRKFKPRDSIINQLTPKTKKIAVCGAECMFDPTQCGDCKLTASFSHNIAKHKSITSKNKFVQKAEEMFAPYY